MSTSTTEVVVETVDEDWTEENLAAYAAKLDCPRKVGLPEQPVHNLANTENLGVEVMESAPTDSSRSSPVRVTESPDRGSVSKRENPDSCL